MRITRQRLKEIILEEMNTLNIDDDTDEEEGNAPSNQGGMSEISESEGMELVQQVAQTLFDTGVTAAESPQELAMALKGIGKMALLALGGGALGVAATAGADAINKIRGADSGVESDDMPLDEEEGGTLGDLIKQAVQEQLEEMRG